MRRVCCWIRWRRSNIICVIVTLVIFLLCVDWVVFLGNTTVPNFVNWAGIHAELCDTRFALGLSEINVGLCDTGIHTDLCESEDGINASESFFRGCDTDLRFLLEAQYRLTLAVPCPIDTAATDCNSSDAGCTGNTSTTCNGLFDVVNASAVTTLPFGDPCLKDFIQHRCHDTLPVPKIVHYVWFSPRTLDVYTFLSVLSAYRFIRPCLILFHADYLPLGPYWAALRSMVPVLLHVKRTAPNHIFGITLGYVQHKSDIARLEALKEYGGVYLDCDQIVVKDLEEFRSKQFVMCHESYRNLGNSLILSAPSAKFIDLWLKHYRSYNPRQWGIHSTFLPLALSQKYPDLIHIAGFSFIKPDLPGIGEIWDGHYDWRQNHAVHLYTRSMIEGNQVRTNYTLQELVMKNSSLGEIARHVLFGSMNQCITQP